MATKWLELLRAVIPDGKEDRVAIQTRPIANQNGIVFTTPTLPGTNP
jgi:hypothetical protein